MVTCLPVRFALAAIISLSLATTTMAEPIGLMERYALADDRQSMLAELIPGSEDYFFYHCLHYQTSGQLERAETILRDWLAEHKGRETPVISGMLDRQRLLTYGDSPQRTAARLSDGGLHSRQPSQAASHNWGTSNGIRREADCIVP